MGGMDINYDMPLFIRSQCWLKQAVVCLQKLLRGSKQTPSCPTRRRWVVLINLCVYWKVITPSPSQVQGDNIG